MPEPTTPQVQVYDPSGQLVSIAASDLAEAQAQGYQPAPSDPQSGGLLGAIQAGARGALRGETAGFGDTIEVGGRRLLGKVLGNPEWGERSAQDFIDEGKRLEAEHPTASAIGEAGGMVVGSLATGGVAGELGAAARGGSALARAGQVATRFSPIGVVEGAGEAAGALARATLGRLATRGALGRAVAAGAELGARGAAETSFYSAARELNEELLSASPELSAEKIFAAAADGAEGGALLGGGLGAATSLARSGARGVSTLAAQVIERNADKLEGMANEQRWRTLDPLKKYTQEALARVPGGTEGVGQVLKKYDITGNDLARATREGHVGAISDKLDEAVQRVGDLLGELQSSSEGKMTWGQVDDAIEKVIAPVRKEAGYDGVVSSLEKYRASLRSHLLGEEAEAAAASRVTFGGSLQDAARELKANMPYPKDVSEVANAVFRGKVPDARSWERMWEPPPGYRSSIRKFTALDGELGVEGAILNSEGKQVGEFERTFKRTDKGLTVHHDLLELDKSVHGQGIADSIHRSSAEAYRDLGISRVTSSTHTPVAKYTQAKYGFSWPESRGPEMQAQLREYLLSRRVPPAEAEAMASAALEGAPDVARLEYKGRPIGKNFLFQVPSYDARIAIEPRPSLDSVPITIQDALAQRKALDRLVYQETKALDPNTRVAMLRDIRRGLEDKIMTAFDEAATAAGTPEASAKLRELKRDYQALSLAQRAADDSTARMQTNRNLSPSDYLAGIMGGGVPGGLLLGSINHFGRARGNAIAAAALDKAAAFVRARRAIKTVDEQIEKSARAIVLGPTEHPYRSLPAATPRSLRERYEEAKKFVASLAENQRALVERAGATNEHMPKISAALGAATVRAAAFTMNAAPSPLNQRPTLGRDLPERASAVDMKKFVEVAGVARNPLAALRSIERGRMTLAQSQALRIVSPEVFAQLQRQALEVVLDRQAAGDPLAFAARQRLHVLLGVATDPSHDPKMAEQLQQNLAGPNASTEPPAPKPRRPLELADETTPLDRMEAA
ncbi:hypothetical protein [Pendulispora albinea]|uniref:N-acetyltransferase domain-containing protein n=1 Tax=Pendulispora albinea TaxID=2741071 RepID=A0ABZ2LWU4_9BACT